MKKYNIEGGINFFSELYKSLDDEEEDIKDNLCLITNLPLKDNFFKMDCGHKFNYIPLYLDTKNHKQKFNGMEGNSSRLSKNEIRCPYCRNRHKGVLPYHEELGLDKIDGVNYVNPNYNYINSVGKMWIYQYTLALCREVLGYVRGKYSTVPIPGSEVTLNQNDLLTDARSQKEAFLAQLRETLNEVGRQKQLEKLAANSENLLKVLNDVPMGLYIF